MEDTLSGILPYYFVNNLKHQILSNFHWFDTTIIEGPVDSFEMVSVNNESPSSVLDEISQAKKL